MFVKPGVLFTALFFTSILRAQPVKIVTAKFGECDPVVDLKEMCVGWRPSSDCEKKFDAYLNEKFVQAVMKPVEDYFYAFGYRKKNNELRKSLDLVSCGDEKAFYTTSYGLKDGIILLENNDLPNLFTPERLQGITDSLEVIEKTKSDSEPDMSKIIQRATHIWGREVENSARQIHITCSINFGIINDAIEFVYGGPILLLSHEGANFIAYAGKRTGSTHGKDGINITTLGSGHTLIGIGKFAKPTIQPYDKTTTELLLHPQFNRSASHLSVQNILIRIQAVKELSDRIIEVINWKTLNAMIDK